MKQLLVILISLLFSFTSLAYEHTYSEDIQESDRKIISDWLNNGAYGLGNAKIVRHLDSECENGNRLSRYTVYASGMTPVKGSKGILKLIIGDCESESRKILVDAITIY